MPYRCHAVSGEKTGFPTAAASFGGANDRLAFSDFPISRRQRHSSTARTPATDEGQYALARAAASRTGAECLCMRAHAQAFRASARRSGAGKGILPFVRCRRSCRTAVPLPSGNRKIGKSEPVIGAAERSGGSWEPCFFAGDRMTTVRHPVLCKRRNRGAFR